MQKQRSNKKMSELIKYVMTAPCYLLSDETWDKCCEVFNKYNDETMYGRFNDAVAKALTEFSGYPAYVCDTGFGDWSNEICGTGVIKPDFGADAGMVCVCRLTHKILDSLYKKYGEEHALSCIAMFEMSEHIKVDFDVSDKNWTRVFIQDKISGNEISSMDSNDFYYDSDDEYFEDEEDEDY